MTQRIFITGTGIISAIGYNTEEVYHSLKNDTAGIRNLSGLDSIFLNELPVGEIPLSNSELRQKAEVGISAPFSRGGLLGVIAAREAIKQSGTTGTFLNATGLVSATTVGGMDQTEVFYRKFLQDKSKGRLRHIVTHDCGDSTEKIAMTTGIGGYLATVSTACSSSANAILFAARLIKSGKAERVLAGGTDALTLFTINGFNSLMILDREHCRPFDNERNGLNLGEGAAFLMLESERSVREGNKKVICELKGYGNACDAFHQTASSPEGYGAFLSMEKALDVAGLKAPEIQYINTHGTGTQNNDLSEGRAIERLFGNNVPLCSSTKAFTGHTLGAAGAVEAVICCLSLSNQVVFPSLNFRNRMEELHFSPVTEFSDRIALNHVMSNSFGFGGNNTSLVFSR